jgi:hypothetical protein
MQVIFVPITEIKLRYNLSKLASQKLGFREVPAPASGTNGLQPGALYTN